MILLGFDPGGIKSFGWSALEINDDGEICSLKTGVVSNAPDAISRARESLGAAPDGVGIDAPLYWVGSGDRLADANIRTRVVAAGGHSGTVSSVNSLRGACLVQGLLVARLVADVWPAVAITEAHPKALIRLSFEASRFAAEHVSADREEHERDAALAAFSAWAAVRQHKGWRNLVFGETAPIFPFGTIASYWFPQ